MDFAAPGPNQFLGNQLLAGTNFIRRVGSAVGAEFDS